MLCCWDRRRKCGRIGDREGILQIGGHLGPFYHLTEDEERNQCVSEIHRVLKAGGIVIAGFIPCLNLFVWADIVILLHKYSSASLRKLFAGAGEKVRYSSKKSAQKRKYPS